MKSNEGQYAVKSLNQTVRFPTLGLAKSYLEQMKRMGVSGEIVSPDDRPREDNEQDRKD